MRLDPTLRPPLLRVYASVGCVFLAYLFCGLMAALAGLVIAARIGSGDPQSGSQFTLASITAVVVGGTSIFGGRGTMIGTLLGAIFVVLMQNSLNQLHVTAYYQYIWTGALMLLAVAAYSIRESKSFRRKNRRGGVNGRLHSAAKPETAA